MNAIPSRPAAAKPAPGTLRRRAAVLLGACIVGGALQAKPAPSAVDVDRMQACPVETDPQAWWTGFADSALNLLQALASRRLADAADGPVPACLQAELSAAYVHLRVAGTRLAILQEMAVTAARQADLVREGLAPAGAAAEVIAQRLRSTAGQMQHARVQQMHQMQVISRLTGLSEAHLVPALEPALSARTVPLYRMEIPAQLPAAALPQHDGAAAREAPLPVAVQALHTLSARSSAATLLAQRVTSRRLEYESTTQRRRLGQASELEAAERYYAMLHDADRLATANGDLALAWIGLHRRLGGALQIERDRGNAIEAIGAGPGTR